VIDSGASGSRAALGPPEGPVAPGVLLAVAGVWTRLAVRLYAPSVLVSLDEPRT
jgi:hypothetical protein